MHVVQRTAHGCRADGCGWPRAAARLSPLPVIQGVQGLSACLLAWDALRATAKSRRASKVRLKADTTYTVVSGFSRTWGRDSTYRGSRRSHAGSTRPDLILRRL